MSSRVWAAVVGVVVVAVAGPILALTFTGSSGPQDATSPVTDGVAEELVATTESDASGDMTADAKKELLRQTVRASGPKAGVDLLARWMAEDPSVIGACHTLSHVVGQEAARVVDPKEAVSHEPGTCQNGYLHGVLQTYALEIETTDVSALVDACSSVAYAYRRDCAHGLGHLLTLNWPDDIDAAMATCLDLPNGFVSRCIGGVTMEFGSNYLAQRKGERYDSLDRTMGPDGPIAVTLTDAQVTWPCASVDGTGFEYECWTEVAMFWIAEADGPGDTVEMAERCLDVEMPFQTACLQSIGGWSADPYDSGSMDNEGMYETANLVCGPVPAAAATDCMFGVFSRFGGPRDIDLIEPVCDRWSGAMREGCRSGLDQARSNQADWLGDLAND